MKQDACHVLSNMHNSTRRLLGDETSSLAISKALFRHARAYSLRCLEAGASSDITILHRARSRCHAQSRVHQIQSAARRGLSARVQEDEMVPELRGDWAVHITGLFTENHIVKLLCELTSSHKSKIAAFGRAPASRALPGPFCKQLLVVSNFSLPFNQLSHGNFRASQHNVRCAANALIRGATARTCGRALPLACQALADAMTTVATAIAMVGVVKRCKRREAAG
eukprot:6200988-Pleurochrysis_carterae.AAC.2